MAKRFEVTIDLSGDAFFEYPGTEIARILTEVAERVDGYGVCDLSVHPWKVLDINGNTVGSYQLREV